ncbi:MAG: GIY-YIG nuclease family protein [Patescibacteria group bacterium]
MYIVYVIQSQQKDYTYVGMTDNLERRLEQHNKGKGKSTRPYAPFKLLYQEELPDRIIAREREKYFKSGVGREFIKSFKK